MGCTGSVVEDADPARRLMIVLFALLLWLLAEAAVVALLAEWAGAAVALLLLVGLSVAGWFVLRGATRAARNRAQQLSLDPSSARTEDLDLFTRWLAGLLLLIPGILSGIVGLILLIPPVQAVTRDRLTRRFAGRVGPFSAQYTVITGEVVRNDPDPEPGPYPQLPPAAQPAPGDKDE